jgi:aryl sulfotransferase
LGIFHDTRAFFRGAGSREWEQHLTADDLAEYADRAAALAPADLVDWIHRS